MSQSFDLIVIGAGPGGYVCAIRAAQLGLKVAIVEKRDASRKQGPALGGTCLNVGCIPSKALLDSAEHVHQARHHFKNHGILIEEPRIDLRQMMKRKQTVIDGLVDGIAYLMKKNGITVLAGEARLGEGLHIDLAKKRVRARHIVLAMGSEPSPLPSLPIDGKRIVDSSGALAFSQVPERLVVVGGGVIGLELGSVWAKLGSQVTVLEYMPQIIPGSDVEMARELAQALVKSGLRIACGHTVSGSSTTKDGLIVHATDAEGQSHDFPADRVLVAVGRRPASAMLADTDIACDERGRVQVDERFTTSRRDIYAIGDLIAGPMLAHKAEEEGLAVAEIIAGHRPTIDYHLIPGVVYTHPELATVGLSEEAASSAGHALRIGRFNFKANGRAAAAGESTGLVKLIVEASTDRLLGVGILGARASDLIAECATVMAYGGSAADIAHICHAHPTFSEAIREAALDANGRILHG